jgi:hypothetical protein
VFAERDCVTLVRPAVDESALQTLGEKGCAPRREFEEQIAALRQRIFGAGRGCVKKINGQPLSGAALSELARLYCAAMNDGKVPTILRFIAFIFV